MNASARGLLAAAALLAALPPQSWAQELRQTAGSQIMVTECNPHRHEPGTAHPWIDPYGVWHPAAGAGVTA